MLKRLFVFGSLLAMLSLTGCASISPFYVNPADQALKYQVIVALGGYANEIQVSAAGGRVYLSGWLPNILQEQDVLARAGSVPGVKEIVDEIWLSDMGYWGNWYGINMF